MRGRLPSKRLRTPDVCLWREKTIGHRSTQIYTDQDSKRRGPWNAATSFPAPPDGERKYRLSVNPRDSRTLQWVAGAGPHSHPKSGPTTRTPPPNGRRPRRRSDCVKAPHPDRSARLAGERDELIGGAARSSNCARFFVHRYPTLWMSTSAATAAIQPRRDPARVCQYAIANPTSMASPALAK